MSISTRALCRFLLAASVLAGCATTPNTAPEAPDPTRFATVYVYHQSESAYATTMGALALRRAQIYIDDKKYVSLGNGDHVRLPVVPGSHTVQAKVSLFGLPGLPLDKQTIDAVAGSNYYFHYFETPEAGYVMQSLVRVDEATGSKGVASTKAVAGATGN